MVGFVALAVVPVLGLNSLATADTATGSRSEGGVGAPKALSDEQRQCLAGQGVTLPARPADGTRPEITDEQRAAMRAAAETCGLPAPQIHGHVRRPALTDEQRQCLSEQGVTLPARPADGTRPELTEQQHAEFARRRGGLRAPRGSPGREARYAGVTGRPGCGSPTSNHHPASCSISRTVARSSSLRRPGWRSPRTTASER